jgi:signal transduction histidine kinase
MNKEQELSSPGNILVVDDKPENLRLLSTLLSERGYQCRAVLNGPMALRAVQTKAPDLVLLDIMMPQMDGYEVCQKLKEDQKTREIPVIFLSAKDEVFDKIKAFTLGAVDYISKPFQVEEVLARIENQLVLRRLQMQLKEQNVLLQQEINSRLAVEKTLQEQNVLLQQEINSRLAVEKILQEQNILLQKEISERQRAELALQKTNQELARSNAELEQFASIASHDLQAPLATIANYAQLLEERDKDNLDAKAHQFIHKIVKGSSRMQKLIDDLLEYSRVSSRGQKFEVCDCNRILEEVMANLQGVIHKNKASLSYSLMPVVMGDNSQLVQLFQNLISNAIKYHGDEPPVIEITSLNQNEYWLFAVRDNGIGIDSKYFSRIFQIFQRLHTQEAYSGTGIGLAICQKILARHGGKIWVESELGQGATFYFTLPQRSL